MIVRFGLWTRRDFEVGDPTLPTADEIVTHTLLNCLLREVCGPDQQAIVADGYLLVLLPRRGVLLRIALRRTSLIGAHRFCGPIFEQRDGDWVALDCRQLAMHVHAELTLRTGIENDEFLSQLASSYQNVRIALTLRPKPSGVRDRYLESEQSLLFGHRFHPTPKARSGTARDWTAYAPEAGARFPVRHLAVRPHLIIEDIAAVGAATPIDRLGDVPDGYRLLPIHPWQYDLLRDYPPLRTALGRGDIVDLGVRGALFTPTASVRTLYDGQDFLKFSLDIRITNCVRKNAAYELAGAVALTRLLALTLHSLSARFPDAVVLRESAYRSVALRATDPNCATGSVDTTLLEGFGVIVRDGLGRYLRSGVTALLAAAMADEYPTSPAHLSRLPACADPIQATAWWTAYLRLLVPPVLTAYFEHGVVFEPHLQNVVVGIDPDGIPVQVFFRDFEGTKLLPDHHADALAALPVTVSGPLTYDAQHGWDRVVYCLLVNHIAEMLAVLADLHPRLERALWMQVRRTLQDYADTYNCPPRLGALLTGDRLPAKANLLSRWHRNPDRDTGYVRLPSPLIPAMATDVVGSDRGRP
ncbi:siderophore synthetase component [Nocardia sp. GAS34]|uniref:IucA/IucC family protein n=1 Tax=Nocardia sp. GP40 TaxID=3156268 RepID=UPI003D238A3C